MAILQEECKEQSKLDNMGSLTSINEIGSLSTPPEGTVLGSPSELGPLSTPPDVVPTHFDKPPVQERRREETAL